MPFVFISHASQNKPRLKPLIEELFAVGLRPFIDKPELLGFAQDRNFLRLRAGERWADQIDQTLIEADCILVCWSQLAADDDVRKTHGTWLDEASFGLKLKKLVCCTIDDVDPQKLPVEYRAEHMHFVSPDLPPERLQAALSSLMADIKGVMARSNAAGFDKRKVQPPRKLLAAPYLANRVAQEQDLDEVMRELGDAGGVRPVFVASPDNELPFEFRQRIDDLSFRVFANLGGWQDMDVVWPTGCPPQEFASNYRRALWRKMEIRGQASDQMIAAHLEGKGKPVAIFHTLVAKEWGIDEIARVQAWLDYWSVISTLSSRLRVVPWLQVIMPKARPGWDKGPQQCPPGGAAGGKVSNRTIWQSIKTLQAKLERDNAPVRLVVPPILPPIDWGDAVRWVMQTQTTEGPQRDKLKQAIEKIYARPRYAIFSAEPMKVGVNHDTFANALMPMFKS